MKLVRYADKCVCMRPGDCRDLSPFLDHFVWKHSPPSLISTSQLPRDSNLCFYLNFSILSTTSGVNILQVCTMMFKIFCCSLTFNLFQLKCVLLENVDLGECGCEKYQYNRYVKSPLQSSGESFPPFLAPTYMPPPPLF